MNEDGEQGYQRNDHGKRQCVQPAKTGIGYPCRGAVFPQGHAEGTGGADKEKNIPTYFTAIFFPSDQSDSGQGEKHAPQHGGGGQREAVRAG